MIRKVLLDSVTGKYLERYGIDAAAMIANGAGRYSIADSSDLNLDGTIAIPDGNRELTAKWNIAPYDRCNPGDRISSNAN